MKNIVSAYFTRYARRAAPRLHGRGSGGKEEKCG